MNKVVVISGASSGLGLELSKILNGMGYYICALGRSAKKLEQAGQLHNKDYKYFVGDIEDQGFVDETIKQAGDIGKIHCVINNASEGVFVAPTLIGTEEINKCLKGTKGMMLLSAAALRQTQERDLVIINILSTAALKGKKMEAAYCMAKWGQRGYTESLKEAYKDTSVKVVGVYVGGMNTNLYVNSRDYISEEKQTTFMDPGEIAEKVVNWVFVKREEKDITIQRKK